MILGKPLIMYGGLLTLLLFLATAAIAGLNRKGITRFPIVWHYRLAYLAILLGLLHGLLGVLAFF